MYTQVYIRSRCLWDLFMRYSVQQSIIEYTSLYQQSLLMRSVYEIQCPTVNHLIKLLMSTFMKPTATVAGWFGCIKARCFRSVSRTNKFHRHRHASLRKWLSFEAASLHWALVERKEALVEGDHLRFWAKFFIFVVFIGRFGGDWVVFPSWKWLPLLGLRVLEQKQQRHMLFKFRKINTF